MSLLSGTWSFAALLCIISLAFAGAQAAQGHPASIHQGASGNASLLVPAAAAEEINIINSKATTWKAAYNPIAAMSEAEFKQLLGAFPPDGLQSHVSSIGDFHVSSDSDIPDYFDWRDRHGLDYMTPVKNQASCGSCWAFGTIGALEGAVNTYYNNVSLDIDLSEQDLVSCDSPPNEGCNGGWLDKTLDYIENNSVSNETCFPYNATDVSCSEKCDDWRAGAWGITGYGNITLGDIDAIKEALMTRGPLVVAFDVYEDFPYYYSGIYRHTFGEVLGGHVVALVGFGKYDGETYWICKNSWGTSWGEGGYFRIFAGECGIDTIELHAIDAPIPPASMAPLARNCVDSDNDSYCNWGIGAKPDPCSVVCNDIVMDCDDSNASIYEGCGDLGEATGFLNIASNPSGAGVYVVSPYNASQHIYRGITPINFTLNAGERTVVVTKTNYYNKTETVNIGESETTELDVELEPSCGCDTGSGIYVCGDTIYNSCNMTCDLEAANTSCFTIGANDITIDFRGYSITGDSHGANHYEYEYGVGISDFDGTTLIDGRVNGFTRGVYASGAHYTQILGGNYSNNGPIDDLMNFNNGYNIAISNSEDFVIENVTVDHPSESEGPFSCPFLYSWNGSKFDFQSDLLFYATADGFLTANGTVPAIPEDYYLISKDDLAAKDGKYDIRIVEERPEINYLDSLDLYLVEHEEGSQVFIESPDISNPGAPMTVHAISESIAPLSCITDTGEDCLDEALAADGNSISIGEVNEPGWHYLELDFGVVPGDVDLVFKGNLVYPSTSEGEEKTTFFYPWSGIDVYDGSEWAPSGKLQSVTHEVSRYYPLDITGIAPENHYKIRMKWVLNMNIDKVELGIASAEPVNIIKLNASSAMLQYHGLSRFIGGGADAIYDEARDVSLETSYFGGNYTRYGDVMPLLSGADDKYVIFDTGSEVSASFDEYGTDSDYDFILYTNGFYKGMTSVWYSDWGVVVTPTVEPLPFHGMSSYPYPDNESYPSDADHDNYLAEWNTWVREGNSHNSRFGIYISYSTDGEIINVNGSESGVNSYGIYLEESDYIHVTNCRLLDWEHPIWLHSSDGCSFTNNTITASSWAPAIRLGSDVIGNTFLNNTITSDLWVDCSEAGANYFNDSFMGNAYYLADGTPSWDIYNIEDTGSDGWADEGGDLPFGSALSSPTITRTCYMEGFGHGNFCGTIGDSTDIGYSGWSNDNLIYDGDWETGSNYSSGAYFQPYYYRPPLTVSAIWIAASDRGALSMDISEECFDYNPSFIQLLLNTTPDGQSNMTFYCRPADDEWLEIGRLNGTVFNEEGVNWTLAEGTWFGDCEDWHPWAGLVEAYCGDGECSNHETCHTCSEDCGKCEEDTGGGAIHWAPYTGPVTPISVVNQTPAEPTPLPEPASPALTQGGGSGNNSIEATPELPKPPEKPVQVQQALLAPETSQGDSNVWLYPVIGIIIIICAFLFWQNTHKHKRRK